MKNGNIIENKGGYYMVRGKAAKLANSFAVRHLTDRTKTA